MSGNPGRRIGSANRIATRQKLVENDTKGINIAASVNLGGAGSRQLLRRRVTHLAKKITRSSSLDFVLESLGDTQIDQFHGELAIGVEGEHQVIRRDIAMHEALAMQVVESAERLNCDLQGQRRRRAIHFEKVLEGQSLDQLHDDKSIARGVDGKVKELSDLRMTQPDGHLGFAQKTSRKVLVLAQG